MRGRLCSHVRCCVARLEPLWARWQAETDERMCRYVQLPGLAEKREPQTGRPYFGKADHFFSYSWDSPFDDVVDAVCTHSHAQASPRPRPPSRLPPPLPRSALGAGFSVLVRSGTARLGPPQRAHVQRLAASRWRPG